jgi:FKBP-type peptidyl-prolyl cis-trans isomerase SlyD
LALTYKVIDKKTKDVLSEVEFPLGYIQGISEVLSSEVTAALVGQEQGDAIELPIICDEIYGPRDESYANSSNLPSSMTILLIAKQ